MNIAPAGMTINATKAASLAADSAGKRVIPRETGGASSSLPNRTRAVRMQSTIPRTQKIVPKELVRTDHSWWQFKQCVSESPGLVGAAAGIPKVMAVREPKAMDVVANGEILARAQHDFLKKVAVIHLIEERKPRVNTGCGKDREECTVNVVVGIAVAGGIVVAAAKPGAYLFPKVGLKTDFQSASTSSLSLVPPAATLPSSPCKKIELASGGGKSIDKMAAVGANVDCT